MTLVKDKSQEIRERIETTIIDLENMVNKEYQKHD